MKVIWESQVACCSGEGLGWNSTTLAQIIRGLVATVLRGQVGSPAWQAGSKLAGVRLSVLRVIGSVSILYRQFGSLALHMKGRGPSHNHKGKRTCSHTRTVKKKRSVGLTAGESPAESLA